MKDMYEDLEELCEVAGRELGDSVDKLKETGGKISAGDAEYLNNLTHMIKSTKTTMAMMDAEEGGAYARGDRSYNDGGSYARRRDSMGRYTSRRAYDDGYGYRR